MQIFVSYSRVDKAFAQRLVDDLVKNHYHTWFDLQDIPHGANWDLEVQRGLEVCDTMVVMLSPPSAASQNVADEWSYFIEKKKRIIPLLIQPTDVPFRLSRRQRVDFTQGYDQGLAELLRALQEVVPVPATNGGGSAPRTATSPDNDDSSASLAVTWAERYHWWGGLLPPFNSGSATVTEAELRLIAPGRLPFIIPLTSLVSAKIERRPWEFHLSITFVDRTDVPHSLILLGTQRKSRQVVEDELLNLLKLHSGRSLT